MSQPPPRFEEHESGAYLHGTKAVLEIGDLLTPGFGSNYEADRISNYIYFSKTLDAAAWGAEFAVGESPERIYLVEPTGDIEDDPNVTDKKFPGNPTMSYRSISPIRIVGELEGWTGHTPEQIAVMQDGLAELRRTGKAHIED